MIEFQMVVNDRALGRIARLLIAAPAKNTNLSIRWLRKFVNFTERKMKQYSRARTPRATGRLSSSIRSEYHFSMNKVSGLVYVPESIKYQFAAEEGIQRNFSIKGKPQMSFHISRWKNPGVYPNSKGYFVFRSVRRGKYRGRRFTARAFQDLMNYYSANEQEILNSIGNSFLFSLT